MAVKNIFFIYFIVQFLFILGDTVFAENLLNSDQEPESSNAILAAPDECGNIHETKDYEDKTENKLTGSWGTSDWFFDELEGILRLENGVLGDTYSSPWNTEKISASQITEIQLAADVRAPSDSAYLFSSYKKIYLTELKKIKGELNTINAVNMSFMFDNATKLETLDVSGWDTSNVRNMSAMFAGTSSLKELDVSGWDVSNVTNMSVMFDNATKLEVLDVLGWNTSNVRNMSVMFARTSSLKKLDVSSWDVSNVTNTSVMFAEASSLKELDMSNWNTSKVKKMDNMFDHINLEKLILGQEFRFVNGQSAGLGKPSYSKEGETPTGNWIREDGNSKSYSPSDFMLNYGLGDLVAGSYVAELGRFAKLESFLSFERPTNTVKIGENVLSVLNLSHDSHSDPNSLLSNLHIEINEYLKQSLQGSFKIILETYNCSDEQIATEELFMDEESVGLPDLPYGKSYKVKLQGKAWNNTTISKENYRFTIYYKSHVAEELEKKVVSGYYGIISGNLTIRSPESIVFQQTKLENTFDRIINRDKETFSLLITDYRGTNPIQEGEETIDRQNWEVVVLSSGFQDRNRQLIPQSTLNLVYISEGKIQELSKTEEILVKTHSVEGEEPKENTKTNLTWGKEEGLKAIVHNRTGLYSEKDYTAQVTFELREAP